MSLAKFWVTLQQLHKNSLKSSKMTVAIMSEFPKFYNTKSEKRHFLDTYKPIDFLIMGKILYLLVFFS